MLKLSKMPAMVNPREMMTVLNMIEVQMKMFQLQLRVIQLQVQARMDLNVNHQGRLLILMQKGQHLRVIPVSILSAKFLRVSINDAGDKDAEILSKAKARIASPVGNGEDNEVYLQQEDTSSFHDRLLPLIIGLL
ncbi:hypothetical protein Hdeb2414_s0015g00444501 [Helianthus debilis subsp. tardiflorus]